jgi:hypothetical protein
MASIIRPCTKEHSTLKSQIQAELEHTLVRVEKQAFLPFVFLARAKWDARGPECLSGRRGSRYTLKGATAGAMRSLNFGGVAGSPKIEGVPLSLEQSPVQDNIQIGAAYRRVNTSRVNSGRVWDAPRVLALWHLASLDAPTVAVVWSLAFAWAAHVSLSGRVLLVLALATWSAYVGDRILDARAFGVQAGADPTMRRALRERHYFHWRNRRLLVPLAAAAACVAGVVVLSLLPSFVRERGFILAAAALAYFSGVHTAPWLERRRLSLPRLVSKEFLVAVLFTAGCILPAWSRLRASGAQEFLLTWLWICGIFFAALAWLNCRLIAEWEEDNNDREAGEQHRRTGTFKLFPAHSTNFSVAVLLASAGFTLAYIAAGLHSRASLLTAAGALSALLLATLDSLRTRMTPLALRACADFVLLTPLLLFLR